MSSHESYSEAEGILRALWMCAVNGGGPSPTVGDFRRARELGLVTGVNPTLSSGGMAVLVALGAKETK